MYCLIVNGNPEPSAFDEYLDGFIERLAGEGHETKRFDLREMRLGFCTGCWSCWWKTPGLCSIPDDMELILREYGRADLVVWASPLILGNMSALLKRAQDRFVPMVHPYIEVKGGEYHHRPRYARNPDIGLIVGLPADEGPTAEDKAEDLAVVRELFRRFSLNALGGFTLFASTETSLGEAVDMALTRRPPSEAPQLPAMPLPAPRDSHLGKARHLGTTLFLNGSPRGRESNSRLIISWLISGLSESTKGLEGPSPPIFDLAKRGEREAQLRAFQEAEEIVLVFPLYTDSAPSLVKDFLEALAGLEAAPIRGKRLAFVVQSGFPESIHSETIALWLARACARLGLEFAGAINRGGIEGIRIQPESWVAKTKEAFIEAGREFGRSGVFSAELRKRMAGRRQIGRLTPIVYPLLALTGITNFYWNMMLKKNGAYDRRFDAPYGEAYAGGRGR